jgi:hypothetical protein
MESGRNRKLLVLRCALTLRRCRSRVRELDYSQQSLKAKRQTAVLPSEFLPGASGPSGLRLMHGRAVNIAPHRMRNSADQPRVPSGTEVSMSTKDVEHGEGRAWLSENVRGALIMVIGVAALIGISYGAMLVLTSPDGWVAQAARSATSGEQASAVSFGSETEPQ